MMRVYDALQFATKYKSPPPKAACSFDRYGPCIKMIWSLPAEKLSKLS